MGWKVSPSRVVPAGETLELAAIEGQGAIEHIWLAVPLGDFFGQGWGEFAPLLSEPIVVAPNGGMNSYFPWRRANPVPAGEVFTLPVDGARGRGRYVGTYLAIGVNSPGWWGEGEVKFFFDNDDDPTICGTGTENYFGGAWDFEVPSQGYSTYTSSFLGLHQVIRPDGLYRSQMRFGMYRWHLPDPVNFEHQLKVTVQDLGWRPDGRYLARSGDMASVAYWYSEHPAGARSQRDLLRWPPRTSGPRHIP